MKDNNIIQDMFDELTFKEIVGKSKKLQESIERGTRSLDLFPALAQDLYASLYRNDPQLTDEPPYGTEFNRKNIETFMEDQRFTDIRGYSVLDDFSSASATYAIMDEIIYRLENDEEFKNLAQQQNDMKNKKDEDKGEASQQMKQASNQMQNKIRQALRVGIKQAQQELQKNEEAFASIGWGKEDGEMKKMSFEDKDLFIQQYKKVQDMAKYIGKYKDLASSSRVSRVKDIRTELCGVTMGNNITRALPQELIQLSHPLLKYDVYRKMQERQLLQYELEMEETRGEGSIVCLVDDSGSMYPELEPIARGIMFGLMKCAEKDNRNFSCDIFSSSRNNFTRDILKGKPSPKDVIDLLSVSFEGGTDYGQPLRFALDKITESEFKDGDIVLITDGECALSTNIINEIVDVKEKYDCKITTVLVGDAANNRWIDMDNLRKWSDYIYTDLGDETLTEIYKNM